MPDHLVEQLAACVAFLLDEAVVANLPLVERQRIAAEVGNQRLIKACELTVALGRAQRDVTLHG